MFWPIHRFVLSTVYSPCKSLDLDLNPRPFNCYHDNCWHCLKKLLLCYQNGPLALVASKLPIKCALCDKAICIHFSNNCVLFFCHFIFLQKSKMSPSAVFRVLGLFLTLNYMLLALSNLVFLGGQRVAYTYYHRIIVSGKCLFPSA